ncbi:MAG TPA: GGDEF domain-containing protein [Spirochaetia bacterium]|nr:GGDEF domain-containing protein [Spirochaetia bacterium]
MTELTCVLYFLDKKLTLLPGKDYTIGRYGGNDVCLPGPTTSREHARIVWREGRFEIEDAGSTNGVIVNGRRCAARPLADGDHILIGTSYLVFREIDPAAPADVALENELSDTLIIERQMADLLKEAGDKKVRAELLALKQNLNRTRRKLDLLANRDRLTGLANRRSFDAELTRELERVRRYGHPLSLFMIDIDHFKAVNDTYGHRQGDKALEAVAALININTRRNDLTARYGGEEFAVVMPELKAENVIVVAEKIRGLIEGGSKKRAGIPLTVSIGISFYRDKESASRFIEKADKALYEAKRRGRNRVVLYAGRRTVNTDRAPNREPV